MLTRTAPSPSKSVHSNPAQDGQDFCRVLSDVAKEITGKKFDQLSRREIAVLKGLMQGHSNKQIAHDLEISETTVRAHMQEILKKFSATNRTKAAIHALLRIGRVGTDAAKPSAIEVPTLADMAAKITPEMFPEFTRREIETFKELVQGHGNKEIARALKITYYTAKEYVKCIFNKIGGHNRTEVVLYGLLRLSEKLNGQVFLPATARADSITAQVRQHNRIRNCRTSRL